MSKILNNTSALEAGIELKQCLKKGLVVEGVIEKIETHNNMSFMYRILAVVKYKEYTIYVPINEMGFEETEEATKYYQAYMRAMCGATISLCLVSIDDDKRVAIGSRKLAMKKEREKYFFSEEKPLVKAYENGNSITKARIVAVTNVSIRVHIKGIDVKISTRELAHRFMSKEEVLSYFFVGAFINVKITELEVDIKNKTVKISASVKGALPNTMEDNVSTYHKGDIVRGVVTNIGPKGYFVGVGDSLTGVDVYCAHVSSFIMPHIGDVVLCKIKIVDMSTKKIYGEIQVVVEKRS